MTAPFGPASRAWRAADPLEGAVARAARGLERAYGLDADLAALAWELARLPRGLDPAARHAALLLALAVLVEQARGSTRVRVLGPEGAARLADVVGPLVRPPGEAPEDDDEPAPPLASGAEAAAAAQALLAAGPAGGPGGPAPALDGLVGGPGALAPLVLDGPWLAAHRLDAAERALEAGLAARAAAAPAPAAPPDAVEAALRDVLARPSGGVVLAAAQVEAVRRAAGGAVTVITGGPGTGKTSVVAALLRALVRLGVPPAAVALAAPTGKAAARLEEALRGALAAVHDPDAADAALRAAPPRATTLHRLLGWHPSAARPRHHAGSPLEAAVVVVDEASMLDAPFAARLLEAVAPRARLVLLGDADQLPSVAAGAVLRDLVAAPALAGRVVRLVDRFRVDARDPGGAAVLAFSTRVAALPPGDLAAAAAVVHGLPVPAAAGVAPGAGPAAGVALVALPAPGADPGAGAAGGAGARGDAEALAAALRAFVDAWVERHLLPREALATRVWSRRGGRLAEDDAAALRDLFEQALAARLLCATRVGPCGATALNALVARALLARRGADPHGGVAPGEPVVVTRNDHDLGLWNGDQGLCLAVRDVPRPGEPERPPRRVLAFPRGPGFLVVAPELLAGRVERAHASTVHRAQGSEHDHVAVVLPAVDLPLVTREVVYTAVTRARRSATLVAPPALLARALARVVERTTRAQGG